MFSFPAGYLCCVHVLVLHAASSLSKERHPHPPPLPPPCTPPPPLQSPDTLFLSPLPPFLQLWRLSLPLVVTVFISGILEGLRRDETHSFVGGVKKKEREKEEGPRTAQHFICGAARSFMKPEVAPSSNLFLCATSGPQEEASASSFSKLFCCSWPVFLGRAGVRGGVASR